MGVDEMTETPWDVLGYNTLEYRLYEAQRWAWCVKHRKPYDTPMGTGGWYLLWCEECDEERHLTSKPGCATLPFPPQKELE
jgi:hypothetical protein